MITEKLTNLSLKIGLVSVFILAILNLVGSNFLATQGNEVQQLQQQTAQLRKENIRLKNQVAEVSSLANLEIWADSKGFIKISQPLALSAASPVAYLSQ